MSKKDRSAFLNKTYLLIMLPAFFSILKKCLEIARGVATTQESTQVSGQRLIVLILLITIAYSTATIEGRKIKRMRVQKYVGRVQEPRRTQRRYSSFYIGLYGQTWVNYRGYCADAVVD